MFDRDQVQFLDLWSRQIFLSQASKLYSGGQLRFYGSKGLCSKMAFLKWAWKKVNVLSRPGSGSLSFRLD